MPNWVKHGFRADLHGLNTLIAKKQLKQYKLQDDEWKFLRTEIKRMIDWGAVVSLLALYEVVWDRAEGG
ncbi:MAG: hypothetical protein Aurels2KO_57910 [Aureliella sp.]